MKKTLLSVLCAGGLVAGVVAAQHSRPILQASENEVSAYSLAVTFQSDGGCSVVPGVEASGNARLLAVKVSRRDANKGFCQAAKTLAVKAAKLDYSVGDGSVP